MKFTNIIASLVLASAVSCRPASDETQLATYAARLRNETSNTTYTHEPYSRVNRLDARKAVPYDHHIACPRGSTAQDATINGIDTLACCKVHKYNGLSAILSVNGTLQCHLDKEPCIFGGGNPEKWGPPESGQACNTLDGYDVCLGHPRGCCPKGT